MWTFWIAATALLLLAALFLLWPLLQAAHPSAKEADSAPGDDAEARRRQTNVLLFEQHLAEAERDHAGGRITATQLALMRAELARALLRDVSDPGAQETALPGPGRRLVWALALALPGLAVALYSAWGASAKLPLAAAVQQVNIAADADLAAARQHLVTEARDYLHSEPEDAGAWFVLGRTQLDMNAFAEAGYAFGRAVELAGDDQQGWVTAQVYRAQALYLAAANRVSAPVRQIIAEVLRVSPEQSFMLELSAVDALQQGRFVQAAELFARLLGDADIQSERRRFLATGLIAARQGAGLPVPPFLSAAPDAAVDTSLQDESAAAAPATALLQPVPDVQPAPDAARVQVDLALAASVLEALPPEAQLFVLARRPSGGPPLAVQRLTPAQSVQVTLSPADAMLPGHQLGAGMQVQILARLSMTGQAERGASDIDITHSLEVGPDAQVCMRLAAPEAEAAFSVVECQAHDS